MDPASYWSSQDIVPPFLVHVVKSIQNILHRPTPGPEEMRSEDDNIALSRLYLLSESSVQCKKSKRSFDLREC